MTPYETRLTVTGIEGGNGCVFVHDATTLLAALFGFMSHHPLFSLATPSGSKLFYMFRCVKDYPHT